MSIQEFISTAMHLGPIWYQIIMGLCLFIAGLIIGGGIQRGMRSVYVYEVEVE